MQTPEARLISRFNLRRNASPVVIALLSLLPLCLPCSPAHAADAKKPTTRAAVMPKKAVKPIHRPVITWGFKDSLTWLRDTTVNGLLPRHMGNEQLTWNDVAAQRFDLDHQLFKSVRRDTYSDALTKNASQQSGLQLGRNAQFQWDVQRYWTVDDRQEVTVKLGLHFDFR